MNLFFDLFFTLCAPYAEDTGTEWEALGIDQRTWLTCAETEEQCAKRDLGILFDTPERMMQDIFSCAGIPADEALLKRLTEIRIRRMRNAITDIRPEILQTLDTLRSQGHRLCLVSNADIIDTLHWTDSPLNKRMDAVVFSHVEHIRKPCPEIYQLAMQRLGAVPQDSVFIGDGGSQEHFGAKRAGMTTILVTHLRPRTNEELSVLSHYTDYVLDDFAHLPTLLHGERH